MADTKSAKTAKAPAKPKAPAKKPAAAASPKRGSTAGKEPVLLSGGNPQIAKGYGEGPIQEYIAASPGWKQDMCRRLDAIITSTVPGVEKAAKWNSPFYGVERDVWFTGFHAMTKYIKVSFFKGTSLKPMPPGESKQKDVRYLDVYEDGFDEKQFAAWIKQASKLPGTKM